MYVENQADLRPMAMKVSKTKSDKPSQKSKLPVRRQESRPSLRQIPATLEAILRSSISKKVSVIAVTGCENGMDYNPDEHPENKTLQLNGLQTTEKHKVRSSYEKRINRLPRSVLNHSDSPLEYFDLGTFQGKTDVSNYYYQTNDCLEREHFDSADENDIVPPLKKLKKHCLVVKNPEIQAFFKLLEDPDVYDFLLTADSCKKICDKYLLAMVFAYFKRSRLPVREFTRINFFVALYLANDMEEDEEEYKYEIFPWALGKTWKKRYMGFLRKRDKLWGKIGFRGIVSRKCCEEIISIEPNHWAWTRERPEYHAGAVRSYGKDDDSDAYPRGPDVTPRYCQYCSPEIEYDSVDSTVNSWYLSSSNSSSPDQAGTSRNIRIIVNSANRSFSIAGLKQSLEADTNRQTPDRVFLHKEE